MQTRIVAEKLFTRLDTLDPAEVRTFVRRLIDERFFFEDMINILDEGLLVVRAGGEIAQINRSGRRLLGIERRRKVIGEQVGVLIGDQAVKTAVIEFLDAGRDRTTLELHTQYPYRRVLAMTARRMIISASPSAADGPSGSQAPDESTSNGASAPKREVSAPPAPPPDSAAGEWLAVFVFNDVTEMKEQEELRRRQEQTRSLATLTSGVAHEIKNPLNAMSIHTQLIERALKSDSFVYNEAERQRLKQSVRIIGEEIRRLQDITENFLMSARPVKPHFEHCSVNTLIESALDLLRPEIESHGITLEFDPAEDLPDVRVDAAQLRQALLNILTNAVEALHNAAERRLSVRTYVREGMLAIAIADTGEGIPPDNLAKIFEPYFTTRFDGTGLGLFHVYRVVQMHGGEIQVDSEPGKGTTVVVYLPLEAGPVRLLPEEKPASSAPMPS
ncbi:MAG: hypothetical protein Kow0059_14820 [Candidatus Sumerlaeia bacterium]